MTAPHATPPIAAPTHTQQAQLHVGELDLDGVQSPERPS